MNTQNNRPPFWILLLSALVSLMELGVGVSLCVSPADILESVDMKALGVDYLVCMWAVRQLALGIAFGYATYKRSVPMLTLAYVFLMAMFAGDFAIGVWQNETALMATAVVMCFASAALIFALNKTKKMQQ